MSHLMLDLETLDVGPRSVIVTIGAVIFEPAASEVGETLYMRLNIDQQLADRRTVSEQTLVWWMKQSDEARSSTFNVPAIADIHNALTRFRSFCKGNGVVEVWGNGSDFDNVNLASLYADHNVEAPWRFTKSRCFRTLKNLFHNVERPLFEGETHNALDDAVHQARWCQAIYAAAKL